MSISGGPFPSNSTASSSSTQAATATASASASSTQRTALDRKVATAAPALLPINDFRDVCHLPEAVHWMQEIHDLTQLPKEIVALAAAYEELSEWVERDTSEELADFFGEHGLKFPIDNVITAMKSYTLVTVLTRKQMERIDTMTTLWFNNKFENRQITPQAIAGFSSETETATEELVKTLTPRDRGTLRQLARTLEVQMFREVVTAVLIGGGNFNGAIEKGNIKEMELRVEAACIKALLPYILEGNFPQFDAIAPAYRDSLAQEFLAHPFPTQPKSTVAIEEVR